MLKQQLNLLATVVAIGVPENTKYFDSITRWEDDHFFKLKIPIESLFLNKLDQLLLSFYRKDQDN